ncbi:hypothetical protein CEQ90_02210 [Lewinellaceae bacterium SD302]|nr:hypothetical protein CEQ90_02210 [Lewinellaceae bacterium SD302]
MLTRTAERKGHNGSIYQLIRADDGFYSVAGDGWLVHWPQNDPELGKMVAKVEGGQLYSMQAIAEKNLLLAGDINGGLHWLYPEDQEKNQHRALHKKGIYTIHSDGRGRVFCGGGDGVLSKWSLESGRAIESLPLAAAAVRSLCYFEAKNILYAGVSDHHVYAIDPIKMQVIHHWKAHDNSVFSLVLRKESDGSHSLTSAGRDARIKRWQLGPDGLSVDVLKNIPAHNATINELAYSPDGKYLATASRDKTIRLWEADSLKLLKSVEPIRDRGHVNSVNSILWLDERCFVTAGDDRRILEWTLD